MKKSQGLSQKTYVSFYTKKQKNEPSQTYNRKAPLIVNDNYQSSFPSFFIHKSIQQSALPLMQQSQQNGLTIPMPI